MVNPLTDIAANESPQSSRDTTSDSQSATTDKSGATPQQKTIPAFSADLIVQDVARYYPEVIEILMEYGLHCVGCMASGFETLREGSLGHGMPEVEFENMILDCEERIAQVKERAKANAQETMQE